MNKQLKAVLLVAILVAFTPFLDSAIVNVALPAIATDLGGGLITQQWIVDGYLLSLGSLILIAGSLSDIFGRLKTIRLGLYFFGVTSLLCAVAPSPQFLIVSRILQGAAGALLIPSSLALIVDRIKGKNFSIAVGKWTAWTGIAFIAGPLLGGFLVDSLSWRLIFAINVIPIAVSLALMARLIPDPPLAVRRKVDVGGAVLCTVGLAGTVYALIEQPLHGWGSWVIAPLVLGLTCLLIFIKRERTLPHAMLQLSMFKKRTVLVGNASTFFIYGGLAMVTFLLVLFLQQVVGYSAFIAGLSLLPVTAIMFVLSSRFGALSARLGAHYFMGFGPLLSALGVLVIALRASYMPEYIVDLLPGIIIFGLGLAMTVAPLTSAILSDVPAHQSGEASAVNNAVARIAGLLAIAAIGSVLTVSFNRTYNSQIDLLMLDTTSNHVAPPPFRGPPATITDNAPSDLIGSLSDALESEANVAAFKSAMIIASVIIGFGGVLSLIGIKNITKQKPPRI